MSKLKAINILDSFLTTPEEAEKRKDQFFIDCQNNLENMSYWLPKLEALPTLSESSLKIPKTKIIPLTKEWWDWSRSDSYSPEKVIEFGKYLLDELENFLPNQTLFMKTGVFSNKFDFKHTVINDRENLGNHFLDIFYPSMMFGADLTAEVVFREMIENTVHRPTIYEGMPLHTEFRVFYSFDKKEVLGIANYWNPEVMKKGLHDPKDSETYESIKEEILSDYEKYKIEVATMVENLFSEGCELAGQWSVDIMKNGEDFWLIDMARMQKSALVGQMEKL
jgi:hypothetical protein